MPFVWHHNHFQTIDRHRWPLLRWYRHHGLPPHTHTHTHTHGRLPPLKLTISCLGAHRHIMDFWTVGRFLSLLVATKRQLDCGDQATIGAGAAQRSNEREERHRRRSEGTNQPNRGRSDTPEEKQTRDSGRRENEIVKKKVLIEYTSLFPLFLHCTYRG